MLDLSALDEPDAFAAGRPMSVPVSDIDEDPGQPRIEFDEDAMVEMTNSIAAKGVKSPVSLRSNPEKPGKYILNYGARRLRGAKRAGLDAIPAFIDETHDDFDQVMENEQRQNLRPMELALFIRRKVHEGFKKGEIATHLGKANSVITDHLALIDMPPVIEAAFREGRAASPKTVYDLRAVYKTYPEQVDAWIGATPFISRGAVADLAARLAKPLDENFVTTKKAVMVSEHVRKIPVAPSSTKGKGVEILNNPRLAISYQGRTAVLALDRKPAVKGLVFIIFDDTGKMAEVDAESCVLLYLEERADSGPA